MSHFQEVAETAGTAVKGARGSVPIRAVLAKRPDEAWTQASAVGQQRNPVVVPVYWPKAPRGTDSALDLLSAVAAVTLSRWEDLDTGQSRPWLNRARTLVAMGRLPLPRGFEPAAHLEEIRRLFPAEAVGLVGCGHVEAHDSQVGLMRSLDWFGFHFQAAVELWLPESCDQPLKALGYAPERCEHENANSATETPWYAVPPPIGKPHPLSPAEQQLARRVAGVPVLASLLRFNQLLCLPSGNAHRVDVLWPEGLLVIEVDGLDHSQRQRYVADRHRDYELLAAGYLVLRLADEEVLKDPASALEKIRTCVQLRSKKS